ETYWGNINSVGPRSVYDEAKRFSEAITMAYHRHHGVDTRIVRIFNTYGPRRRPRAAKLSLSGAGRRANHGLRRWKTDAQFLLRFRFDRRHLSVARVRRARTGQYRQSE